MKKLGKCIATVMAASVLTLGISACQEKAGPAERAGKEVDKAVENVGRNIEKAGEKIQDAAQDAKK